MSAAESRDGRATEASDEPLLRDLYAYLAPRYYPEYAHMSPALGPLLARVEARLGLPTATDRERSPS